MGDLNLFLPPFQIKEGKPTGIPVLLPRYPAVSTAYGVGKHAIDPAEVNNRLSTT